MSGWYYKQIGTLKMAMIFTIDLIEGNSHIGVPVFSNSAKKENKNYMVFSQPRAPKKIEESDNEEGDTEEIKQQKKNLTGNGPKDFKSVDRLQILQRIKDLEKKQQQVIDQQKSPRGNLSMENITTVKPNQGAKTATHNKNNFVARLTNQSPKLNHTITGGFIFGNASSSPENPAESYAFNAISRDHYYDVHGNKSEMPKNGSYHPRYSLVEKRVQGPVYAKRKALRRAQEQLQKIQQHKVQKFENEQMCTKIFKLLEQQNLVERNCMTSGGLSRYHQRNRIGTQDTQIAAESLLHQSQIPQAEYEHGQQQMMTITPGNPNDPNHPLNINKSAGNVLASQRSKLEQSMIQIQTQNALSSSINYLDQISAGVSQTARGAFGDIRFSFNNQPLTSKYTLLSAYPEKRILKDEIPKLTDQIAPRVISTEFFKRPKRPSFVNKNGAPHELRLNPPDTLMNFNTIHQITSKAYQHGLDIGKVSDRDENLIMKAGEAQKDICSYIANIYNPNKDVILPPTSKQVLDFKKVNARSLHGSIYRKPCDQSPDVYDTKKISKGFNLLANIVHPKSLVDFTKQHKRDLSLHVRYNNEALRNIERQNQRQDFIKKLINDQIDHQNK